MEEKKDSIMRNLKTILISISIPIAIIILNKFGVFRNPIFGTVIIVLILLAVPIAWQIKEYLRKKHPNLVGPTRCPDCGFAISDGTNNCHNCGGVIEDIFTGKDIFEEEIKDKQICPYCGLNELETIYEVSKGYKEECASCGKSRVSRKALKFSFKVFIFFAALVAYFYWLFDRSLK
jgi:hypothetical protein